MRLDVLLYSTFLPLLYFLFHTLKLETYLANYQVIFWHAVFSANRQPIFLLYQQSYGEVANFTLHLPDREGTNQCET